MELDEKQIIIVDEDGTENRYEILFTFEADETHITYVLYYDPSDPENIMASRYDNDGNLEEIETDEEWEMVEEVLNTFQDDPEAAEQFGLDL